MGKLIAFNFVTLNGFYKGPNEDISWHRHGAEENEYAGEGLKSDSILLFGRVTYQMMASYWPTEEAAKNDPGIARGMNDAKKIVFSRTLEKADWNNTRLVTNNMTDEVRKLKQNTDRNLTILGSGNIVTQLTDQGLIDEYQIMLAPVALGNGNPIFKGISHKLDLNLIQTKTFKSGVVLLCYQPCKNP